MVNSMFIEPDDEIHKIVISLNKSAPGCDDVNAQVLKLCILDIRQPKCCLCNASLIEGISQKWKYLMCFTFIQVRGSHVV